MSAFDEALEAVRRAGKPVLVCDHIPQLLLHVPDDDQPANGGCYRYLRRCVMCNADIDEGLTCQ